MLEIKVEGPAVTLRCEGKVMAQISEFAAAFHAWAYDVADETEIRDGLRDIFVNRITDDDVWHIKPDRVEKFVDVDDPEELFNQGGE